MFDFEVGKIIRMKHFTGRHCHKGIIVDVLTDIITVKPDKSFAVFSYFEDDPLVIIHEQYNKVFVCQSSILSIDYKTGYAKLKIEDSETMANRRQYERYPTSLYGVVLNSASRDTVFINNLSMGGANVRTKTNISEGEIFEIETSINGVYFYLKAEVVWKKEHSNNLEYGLKTIDSKPDVKEIIEIIKKEQSATIKTLKDDYQNLNHI